MEEIVAELPSEVLVISSQDRILQRTVGQILDSSVVKIVLQERTWEMCGITC